MGRATLVDFVKPENGLRSRLDVSRCLSSQRVGTSRQASGLPLGTSFGVTQRPRDRISPPTETVPAPGWDGDAAEPGLPRALLPATAHRALSHPADPEARGRSPGPGAFHLCDWAQCRTFRSAGRANRSDAVPNLCRPGLPRSPVGGSRIHRPHFVVTGRAGAGHEHLPGTSIEPTTAIP